MDDVSNLINYLLKSNHSIDRLDTISNQLNLSQEQIHRILRADRYKDYFQLLKSVNQTSEKLVLTLDVNHISSTKKKKPRFSIKMFSYSVVHIMLINAKINRVHFYTCVLTISGRYTVDARIRRVLTSTKF